MLETTSELSTAQQWAVDLLRENNSAKYYMSETNFVAAYKNENSFSFIVQGEPFYGHIYGEGAFPDERCSDIAVAGFKPELIGNLQPRGGFQFWEAITSDTGSGIELLTNPDEIRMMIEKHAPDSTVFPGDPEEIFWGGIRNAASELVALAVLVKWQSGFHVMASVVTREQDRGKGFATQLSRGMITRAHSLGISQIGLGVRENNFAAQRVYENSGFRKLADFTHYSRE